MKKKGREEISFDAYYSHIFGNRWLSLKEALLAVPNHTPFTYNLIKPYYMDIASIAVALCVPEIEEGAILDLCAAPGGKALVLASMLKEGAALQANELSSNRRFRLKRVIQEHLSEERRLKVTITGYDGSVMARLMRDNYDRILVDAPCSSERHVIASSKALKEWSPSRIKNLAIRQWALLSSAFLMLKKGGVLVYSTCALLENENDCVIDKLVKKYKNASVVELDIENILQKNALFSSNATLCDPIRTRCGYSYLPDVHLGAGPMYFSIIEKKSETFI